MKTTRFAFLRTTTMALIIAGVMVGCAPEAAVPTQSVEDTQNMVATSVAMTVAAFTPVPTQASLPTPAPIEMPTNTAVVPVLPTVTPVIFSSGSGGGGGVVYPPQKYDCNFTSQPYDGKVFHPNAPFDVVFVIQNTGTEKWPAGYDLAFSNGTNFTNETLLQLNGLKPGETQTVTFDAAAPAAPGTYVMAWKVNGNMCYPAIQIEVKK